jgi:PHD/YefM family antitoxin component YafN of YafNO toxin-antitoxin module
MITVNALKLRNNLGEIIDIIERDKQPILISKGRKIRAVLITPEQFKTRFLDFQVEEEKRKLLEEIASLKDPAVGEASSLQILRELRGYPS